MKTIDAGGVHYRQLNEQIRAALDNGCDEITVTNVAGHRYIGCGLGGDGVIHIDGIPGNDLAAFMDGPTIRVKGNVQDAAANTMNAGLIVVAGDAGDILGHSIRGGSIFVRGSAGYRVGIHMKGYMDKQPIVVIGGCAGDFFGEYQAGGCLVLLGLTGDDRRSVVGDYCATGMHGGVIYMRGRVEDHQLGAEVSQLEIDENDREIIEKYVSKFAKHFNYDANEILKRQFIKFLPLSHRPYGRLYAY